MNIGNKTIPEIANELLNSTTYKNILKADWKTYNCAIYIDLRILLDYQSEIAKKTIVKNDVFKDLKIINNKKINSAISNELLKSIDPNQVQALLTAA